MKRSQRISNFIGLNEKVFNTILTGLQTISTGFYLYIIISLVTLFNRVSNYTNEVLNYSYLKITKTLSLVDKEKFINYLSENYNSLYWGEIKNSIMVKINELNSKEEIISSIKSFCGNKSKEILNVKTNPSNFLEG